MTVRCTRVLVSILTPGFVAIQGIPVTGFVAGRWTLYALEPAGCGMVRYGEVVIRCVRCAGLQVILVRRSGERQGR